jgi:hypothetical protein
MPPVGFEHTISAGERPKTYALDRAATGTGKLCLYFTNIFLIDKQLLQRTVMIPYWPAYLSTVARTENFLCFKETIKL